MDTDTVSARLIHRAVLLVALALLGVFILLGAVRSGGPSVEASSVGMSLRVYSSVVTSPGNLVCDFGDSKCEVAVEHTFSVDIVTDSPPAGGFTAYKVALLYSGDVNLVTQSAVNVNRVPTCNLLLVTGQ